jgi:hypothetical protein
MGLTGQSVVDWAQQTDVKPSKHMPKTRRITREQIGRTRALWGMHFLLRLNRQTILEGPGVASRLAAMA